MFEDPELNGKVLKAMATAIAAKDGREEASDDYFRQSAKGLQLFSDAVYMAEEGDMVFRSCRTTDGQNNDLEM